MDAIMNNRSLAKEGIRELRSKSLCWVKVKEDTDNAFGDLTIWCYPEDSSGSFREE
jgi:hypothetical protein